ncbi:hypothetical protein HDU97_003543 [Phlyctochytrium planicorne]|nr:hypothetical protein HDU97_003543 [Phlyctochytrium planicorne]
MSAQPESQELFLEVYMQDYDKLSLMKEYLGENLRGLALTVKTLINLRIETSGHSNAALFTNKFWNRIIPTGLVLCNTSCDNTDIAEIQMRYFDANTWRLGEFQVVVCEGDCSSSEDFQDMDALKDDIMPLVQCAHHVLAEESLLEAKVLLDKALPFEDECRVPVHIREILLGKSVVGRSCRIPSKGVVFWGRDQIFTLQLLKVVSKEFALIDLEIFEDTLCQLHDIIDFAQALPFLRFCVILRPGHIHAIVGESLRRIINSNNVVLAAMENSPKLLGNTQEITRGIAFHVPSRPSRHIRTEILQTMTCILLQTKN